MLLSVVQIRVHCLTTETERSVALTVTATVEQRHLERSREKMTEEICRWRSDSDVETCVWKVTNRKEKVHLEKKKKHK